MKSKFLTVLALFVSLSLSACGGATAASSSAHRHSYNFSYIKAPTCTEKGQEEGTCTECGDKITRDANPLGHDFDAWKEVTPPTCATEGKEGRVCKREGCNQKEERPIATLPHTWVDKEAIAASGDGAEYKIIECSVCKKLALVGDFTTAEVNGDKKDVTTADGNFVKLNTNGSYFTVKINVAKDYAKAGKLYLRACMGHWRGSNGSTDNSTESYFSGSDEGNFKIEVNDNAVDYSAMRGLTYADMINDPDPGDANGYSKAADCEVGACALTEGLNVIKYTRLASYNLTIQAFVIVLD